MEESNRSIIVSMSAYPRGGFFQRKFGGFVERAKRVILSETNGPFQLDRSLLDCSDVDIRVTGNLRDKLTPDQLAARPTDHEPTTDGRNRTERPGIDVLAVRVHYGDGDQLNQGLETDLMDFKQFKYNIVYVEVKCYQGNKPDPGHTQGTIRDVIRRVFPNLDLEHQLVTVLTTVLHTDIPTTHTHKDSPGTYTDTPSTHTHTYTPSTQTLTPLGYTHTPISTNKRTQSSNKQDTASNIFATQIETRSKSTQAVNTPSVSDAAKDETVGYAKRTKSSPRKHGRPPSAKDMPSDRSPSKLTRLDSQEYREPLSPMDTTSGEQESIEPRVTRSRILKLQLKDSGSSSELTNEDQRSSRIGCERPFSPMDTTSWQPEPGLPGTQHHQQQHHQQQPQSLLEHQRPSSSETVEHEVTSEFNLGRSISFQIETRLFLYLETVEHEAKKVVDLRSADGPHFSTIDKLLFEIKGLYNQGISNLCRQKRDSYRPIPRSLMNQILDIEHVVGCGRIYDRFTVHIPDDDDIDMAQLRSYIDETFKTHRPKIEREDIFIEKMIRKVENLSLNAA